MPRASDNNTTLAVRTKEGIQKLAGCRFGGNPDPNKYLYEEDASCTNINILNTVKNENDGDQSNRRWGLKRTKSEAWLERMEKDRREGRALLREMVVKSDDLDWQAIIRQAGAMHRKQHKQLQKLERQRKKDRTDAVEQRKKFDATGSFSVNLLTMRYAEEEYQAVLRWRQQKGHDSPSSANQLSPSHSSAKQFPSSHPSAKQLSQNDSWQSTDSEHQAILRWRQQKGHDAHSSAKQLSLDDSWQSNDSDNFGLTTRRRVEI